MFLVNSKTKAYVLCSSENKPLRENVARGKMMLLCNSHAREHDESEKRMSKIRYCFYISVYLLQSEL